MTAPLDPSVPVERAPMSPAARVAHALVRLYQRITVNRPSPCRFVPTCSTYALDALELHGFFRGLWLTTRRIGRCHPWGGHGLDPVPEPTHAHHRSHHRSGSAKGAS
jgi:uncharacterized protein